MMVIDDGRLVGMLPVYDIQRIFVREKINGKVTGVLCLSDATRFRSGTCKACGAGRVLADAGLS